MCIVNVKMILEINFNNNCIIDYKINKYNDMLQDEKINFFSLYSFE